MNQNPYEPPIGDTPHGATPANSSPAGRESTIHRLIVWVVGFVVLFAINALVELVILPRWGLNNTQKNDVYFKLWWFVVGVWFVFGNAIVAAFARTLNGPNRIGE